MRTHLIYRAMAALVIVLGLALGSSAVSAAPKGQSCGGILPLTCGANEFCQLIVRAEICGGQRRECRRIEVRLLTHGRDELPRAVDEQRAARVALEQKPLERRGDRPEVVLGK